jgi:RIO-like serine/threonine protein kinase
MKKLKALRSRIGFKKGGMNKMGSIMDASLMQPVSSLNNEVIKKLRTSFKRGGFVHNDFLTFNILFQPLSEKV